MDVLVVGVELVTLEIGGGVVLLGLWACDARLGVPLLGCWVQPQRGGGAIWILDELYEE